LQKQSEVKAIGTWEKYLASGWAVGKLQKQSEVKAIGTQGGIFISDRPVMLQKQSEVKAIGT
jgi:hypothetical protein